MVNSSQMPFRSITLVAEYQICGHKWYLYFVWAFWARVWLELVFKWE